MKKKILAFILAALLALSAVGCGSTEPAATPTPAAATEAPATALANPVNVVAGYNELLSAQPTVKLNNAPSGASNVAYSWINNIPVISQIEFNYNGANYTYRAAACPGGTTSVDISGVYTSFPSVSTVEIDEPNLAGGSYVLRYDSATGEGVANWTVTYAGCQYSLYTDKGCAGDMPITALMKSLYNCAVGAVKATGTVLSVTGPTVAVTLDNGNSAVLDATYIKTISVKANDKVEFLYFGDLGGDAKALQIIKTGESENVETSTFRGTINYVDDNALFVTSSDNNVFVFTFDANTGVSGAASVLAEKEVVTIAYTGNLYDTPKATEIYIEKVIADATATPKPSTKYVERTCSGTITSVGGNYVSVSGLLFNVNSSSCYVSGTAYVGGWATINYRDYGSGNYVVTSAYFSGTTPTASPYTDRSTSGTVTYVYSSGNDYTVTVNGLTFSFNTRGIGGSGTAVEGAWASIYYRDYGYGYYEVSEAYFTGGSQPDETEYLSTSGYVTSFDYNTIICNDYSMRVASDCTVSGNYSYGCYANISYRHSPNMSHDADEVYYIEFYGSSQTSDPDYTEEYTEGYITSVSGSYVYVNGISFNTSGANYSGYPQVGGYACVSFKNYGSYLEIIWASFSAPEQYDDDTNYLDGDFPDEWITEYYEEWDGTYEEWDSDENF